MSRFSSSSSSWDLIRLEQIGDGSRECDVLGWEEEKRKGDGFKLSKINDVGHLYIYLLDLTHKSCIGLI